MNVIPDSINLPKQCRKYGLSLWQCPQFLFLILCLVVIISSIAIYFIGVRYTQDPEIVVLIVLGVAAFIIIIAYSITRSFERLADVARMKSEFISIVSHQLRSPLASLKWTIDLLMSGKISQSQEKQLTYLQALKENTQRMVNLVSDLLVVSRLETDNLPSKKEPVEIDSFVRNIVSAFLPLSKASNVEIKTSFPPDLPQILSDCSQLSLIIENLLDNSIRYIKSKGLVEVRAEKRSGSLYLEFKDNGIGVSADDQKYIFQKFFRGENALRQQAHGSGLGLYIAKAAVRKLGGKIGFISQEGKGSVFWVTLPIS